MKCLLIPDLNEWLLRVGKCLGILSFFSQEFDFSLCKCTRVKETHEKTVVKFSHFDIGHLVKPLEKMKKSGIWPISATKSSDVGLATWMQKCCNRVTS